MIFVFGAIPLLQFFKLLHLTKLFDAIKHSHVRLGFVNCLVRLIRLVDGFKLDHVKGIGSNIVGQFNKNNPILSHHLCDKSFLFGWDWLDIRT